MNAPATFQMFMEHCIGDYLDEFAVPYLDDLLVYSATFEDHLHHLRLFLRKLKKHNVKIKARKCQLFKREVKYLGRLISADGYRVDPNNVAAVANQIKQPPKNLTELRRLLGLIGYFRKSIPNFSKTAAPLFELLRNHDKSHKNTLINRTSVQQEAVTTLIVHLINPPLLAYPDFTQPFILYTDASGLGLGCALYQYQEGKLRVIGFGSRTLVGAESKYHS